MTKNSHQNYILFTPLMSKLLNEKQTPLHSVNINIASQFEGSAKLQV